MVRSAAAACLLIALCGCGVLTGKKAPELAPGILYSPNGEPLSGGPLDDPKCEDALGKWFDRVDQDHDGKIDLPEFLADARRQFAAMDLDKSGVLTPSVLAQYRQPYLADREGGEDESDRKRRAAAAGNVIDRADPVMLADVSLRNQVTRDQFLAYARRNFASLDRARAGHIDRDSLLASCKR